MQTMEAEHVWTKMESIRLSCSHEISLHEERIGSCTSSFVRSLENLKSKSQQTIQSQGMLLKMKNDLKEAEDELVKAIAVKTCTEAKRLAVMDSISSVQAQLEELKRTVQDQKAKRDEYAAIVSQESLALAGAEKRKEKDVGQKGDIQEAISWYNRFLGFRIEGGNGVRFIFNNIDRESPKDVYSFTIRHANEAYTLLECNPPLDNAKDLVKELNKSNDLYGFVRTMRREFQKLVNCGSLAHLVPFSQDFVSITMSAPFNSVSSDKSRHLLGRDEQLVEYGVVGNNSEEVKPHIENIKTMTQSPGSASSVRCSLKLKVEKQEV